MATTSAAGTLGMRRKSLSITETRIAGLYDLDRTIGKGHFAVVKLARHAFTGEKVAVKVIDKTKLDAVSKEHIMQEVRCMKLVQHPCVVRLYEVIDTQTKLFLILELGDYDMHEFMQRHVRGVAEPEAQRLFAQIINAIDYCHQLHVVHRDLKPENVVFFDKINMVKVTDFGFSNVYAPGTTLDTSCGSLAYSAPEILLGDSYDAPAVDIWSLGVILFMLVAGRLPFEGPNDSETLTKILDCRYHMPEHVSQTCRKLVGRMLIRDPRKRASLKEIRENAWVKGGDFGQVQMLPLVGREQLCDDDHDTIVEQMVMGGVGTAVQINHALEHEQYSHLTATYYLLAESVLRVERQKKAQALMEAQARSNPELGAADAENVPPGDPSPPETYANSEVTSNATTNRQRSCSMVKEESEEELSVLGTSRRSSRATSPSTSTFGLARYVQDRVSPAAIQEMLDVTGRLSSGRRSPDSLSVTSRSPSPPFERTPGQPVTISAIASRLKSGPAGPPGGGGIRKLSSSPHLFGICEELEEGEQAANEGSESPKADRSSSKTTTGGDDGNDTSGSSDITQRESAFRQPVSTARQLRRPFSSSATGILAAASGGHPAQSLQLQPGDADTSNRTAVSYSSVRMIRPRQAIVSPDMLRRYDRPSSCNPSITTAGAPKGTSVVPKTGSGAKSGTSRSRRSTSCSSSEASDDESRNLALSRHCAKHATGRHRRRSGDDKDEGGDGAHAAAGRQAAPTAALSHAKGGQAQQSSGDSNADPGSSSGTKKGRAASAGDVEGPDELQCSCNGKQPSSGLDTSRLIGKLQNLALAPIHEIPQCLPRFMRTASYEVRRASRLSLRNGDTEHSAQQATGDCDMALNQRAGSSAGGDLVRMDLYVRKLRRSRSAERLCHISQPIPEEDEATSRPPIDGMRGDTERVARWLRFSVPENDVIDCEPDAAINSPDYGSILPAGPAAGAQANMAAMYSDSSDEGFHGSHHSSPCEEHLSPLGKQCEVDSAKIDHSIPSTVQVGVQ